MTTYTDYVKSAIEKLALSRKVIWESDGKYVKLQCVNPSHKGGREETPSLRINLVKDKYPIGTAHCWSCGAHYSSWNKLTEALYRPDLAANTEQMEEPDKVASFFTESIEKDISEDDEQETNIELRKDLRAAIPWNKQQEWRGIKGKALAAIDAVMYFDSKLQVPMLYLPCKIHGKEVGGVRARLKKQDKFNYINSEGSWVLSKGLLCYDYAHSIITKKDLSTIVLVEGPRDSLNWCQNGIPTVAILGSNNFNEIKAEILLSLGIERVITAFDDDAAGRKATKLVYNILKDEVEVKNFNLHKWGEKLGIEGLDPGMAPPEVIQAVKKHLI